MFCQTSTPCTDAHQMQRFLLDPKATLIIYSIRFHLFANRHIAFQCFLSWRKGRAVWLRTDVIDNPEHNETQLTRKSWYSQQTWWQSLRRWAEEPHPSDHTYQEQSYYNIGNYCQTEWTDKIFESLEKQFERVFILSCGGKSHLLFYVFTWHDRGLFFLWLKKNVY